MWSVWLDGKKLAEFPKLHSAKQFIAGRGVPCEVRRVFPPRYKTKIGGVTESVT